MERRLFAFIVFTFLSFVFFVSCPAYFTSYDESIERGAEDSDKLTSVSQSSYSLERSSSFSSEIVSSSFESSSLSSSERSSSESSSIVSSFSSSTVYELAVNLICNVEAADKMAYVSIYAGAELLIPPILYFASSSFIPNGKQQKANLSFMVMPGDYSVYIFVDLNDNAAGDVGSMPDEGDKYYTEDISIIDIYTLNVNTNQWLDYTGL